MQSRCHDSLDSNAISSLTNPSSAEQTEKTSPLALQHCEQAPCGAVSHVAQHYTLESPQRRWKQNCPTTLGHSLSHLIYPSLVAQLVNNLPSVQETRVRSLDQEDLLEKEMATHSSILAWKNPLDTGAWWAAVHGFTKSQTQLSD